VTGVRFIILELGLAHLLLIGYDYGVEVCAVTIAVRSSHTSDAARITVFSVSNLVRYEVDGDSKS